MVYSPCTDEGFGLSKTEIGGIVGGLLFLVVAVTLAIVAVMCSRRRDRRKQHTKYGNIKLNFEVFTRNIKMIINEV